jgi:hypothetical protein
VLLALVAIWLLGVDGCSRSHAGSNGAKVLPPPDATVSPASTATADAAAPNGLGCDVLTLPWSWAPGVDTCAIDLMPAADPADKLAMVVTEGDTSANVPHDLGDGAGWTISADGAHVELLGALCSAAQHERFSSIEFWFGCAQHLPSLPPSHLM